MENLLTRCSLAIGLCCCLLGTGLTALAQTPVLINDATSQLPVLAGDKLYFFETRLNFEFAPTSRLWKLVPGSTTPELVASLPFPSSIDGKAQAFGARIGFFVNGPGGGKLWVSDGTAGGTFPVAGQTSNTFQAVGANLFYLVNTNGSIQLWVTDGTATGNRLVSAQTFTGTVQLQEAGGQLFLFNQAATGQVSLWRSSGSSVNLVRDFSQETDKSGISEVVAAYGRIYFALITPPAGQSSGTYTLWQTDGSPTGTQTVGNFTGTVGTLQNNNGNLLRTSIGSVLGPRSTPLPAFFVSKINPDNTVTPFAELSGNVNGVNVPGGVRSPNVTFIRFKNLYYFPVVSLLDGSVTLWRSDGKAIAGISVPALQSSGPDNFTTDGVTLYFTSPQGGTTRLYKITGEDTSTPTATLLPTNGLTAITGIVAFAGTVYIQSGGLYGLRDAAPASTLQLAAPTYDCTTGQLQINLTGSTTGAEYRIAGLRDWSASNVFTVPTWQRTGVSFNLEVRQSGQTASQVFTTSCSTIPPAPTPDPTPTPTPTPTGSFSLTTPVYDCTSGILTAQGTGSATGVEYRIAGLRDFGPGNVFTVPAWQRTGITFTIEARQNGQISGLAFTTACQTVSPTPPSPGALSIGQPGFDCGTGTLTVLTSGGDGSPIVYGVAGLRGFGSSNVFVVPTWQRSGITFVLAAQQSGFTVNRSFTTACPGANQISGGSIQSARTAANEGPTDAEPFTVSAGENPGSAGSLLEVTVRGASGQRVGLSVIDGQGRVISETVIESAGVVEQRWLSTGTAGGLLLLRATTGQQSRTLKLIRD